ncbi:MAG TPA: hypothetical protein EYP04_13105 [Anaerolineae bacterium]|nr:hypothetical protein [Anaerolineae bacterium]
MGNLVMVQDLLANWSPDAVRLYLASHHYREPWSHSLDELMQAEQLAGKLRTAVTARSGHGPSLEPDLAWARFIEAMDQDLNTPGALTVLDSLAEDTLQAARAGQDVNTAQKTLRTMSQVLGLRLDANTAEERVTAGWSEHLRRFADAM